MASTDMPGVRQQRELAAAKEKKRTDRAKALAHPLRVRILRQLEQGKAMSPNQLSVALDEPLGNVSYHVKTLLEFDAVKLTKTEPRRGAVEHFYKPTGKVKAEAPELDVKRSKLTAEAIRHSLSETTAGKGGGVDQVGRTPEQRLELGKIAKELSAV